MTPTPCGGGIVVVCPQAKVEFFSVHLKEDSRNLIELAKALNENRKYEPTRTQVVKDKVSGLRHTVEKSIRLKPIWWSADNKVYIQVKYSNKVLELVKGKNSVEVASSNELINALSVIKKSVDEGALDSQIELVSKSVRARFVK